MISPHTQYQRRFKVSTSTAFPSPTCCRLFLTRRGQPEEKARHMSRINSHWHIALNEVLHWWAKHVTKTQTTSTNEVLRDEMRCEARLRSEQEPQLSKEPSIHHPLISPTSHHLQNSTKPSSDLPQPPRTNQTMTTSSSAVVHRDDTEDTTTRHMRDSFSKGFAHAPSRAM